MHIKEHRGFAAVVAVIVVLLLALGLLYVTADRRGMSLKGTTARDSAGSGAALGGDASTESDLRSAEMADITDQVTVTARAGRPGGMGSVNGRRYTDPIEVDIVFRGDAASEALRVSRVELDSVVDDAGRPLELIGIDDRAREGPGLVAIDRSELNSFRDQPVHPEDGFRLRTRFFNPDPGSNAISTLEGSLVLHRVDEAQTVVFEHVGKMLQDDGFVTLEHPRLQSMGSFTLALDTYAEYPDTVSLDMDLHRGNFPEVRMIDSDGFDIGRNSASFSMGQWKQRSISFDRDDITPNARLELIFGFHSEKVRFGVHDISIENDAIECHSDRDPGVDPVPDISAELSAAGSARIGSSAGIKNGRVYTSPIELQLELTGEIAGEAVRYGGVELESVRDNRGHALDLLRLEEVSGGCPGMATIDRKRVDTRSGSPSHPENGFRVAMSFFKPDQRPTSVAELKGRLIVTKRGRSRVFCYVLGVEVRHEEGADRRKPRLYLPDIPCHVIQRGNNRDVCFAAEQDHQVYLEWRKDMAERYGWAVHAYVLMTNQVHLLVTPQDREGVSRLMQSVGRRYVQ